MPTSISKKHSNAGKMKIFIIDCYSDVVFFATIVPLTYRGTARTIFKTPKTKVSIEPPG